MTPCARQRHLRPAGGVAPSRSARCVDSRLQWRVPSQRRVTGRAGFKGLLEAAQPRGLPPHHCTLLQSCQPRGFAVAEAPLNDTTTRKWWTRLRTARQWRDVGRAPEPNSGGGGGTRLVTSPPPRGSAGAMVEGESRALSPPKAARAVVHKFGILERRKFYPSFFLGVVSEKGLILPRRSSNGSHAMARHSR